MSWFLFLYTLDTIPDLPLSFPEIMITFYIHHILRKFTLSPRVIFQLRNSLEPLAQVSPVSDEKNLQLG